MSDTTAQDPLTQQLLPRFSSTCHNVCTIIYTGSITTPRDAAALLWNKLTHGLGLRLGV